MTNEVFNMSLDLVHGEYDLEVSAAYDEPDHSVGIWGGWYVEEIKVLSVVAYDGAIHPRATDGQILNRDAFEQAFGRDVLEALDLKAGDVAEGRREDWLERMSEE